MKAPPAKAWMPANGRLEVSAEVNTDVEVEGAWRHGVTVVTPRNGHQLCRPPPAPAKRPRTHVWEDIFQFSHHPFPTLSQFQCIYHTHCYLSHSKFNNVEIWEEMWSAKSHWLCHKKKLRMCWTSFFKSYPALKEAYPIWRIAVGCPIKADVAQGAIIRVVGGFGTYNGSCGSSNTFWMYSGVLDLFLWLSTMGL